MKVKEGSERGKCWLKAQHSENEDHGDGETVTNFLFWGAPKPLHMVTAAMKLEDAYSLEGKL